MMTGPYHVELLCPAGDFAGLRAALDNGADAVYFGVGTLNMRAVSSVNFTIDDLASVVQMAKAHNARAYLALNTILYDHDLQSAAQLLDAAKNANVDAVIVSDPSAIAMAAQRQIAVHLSTQLNITNIQSVAFFAAQADTVVLSRELTLSQTAHIVHEIQRKAIRGPQGDLIKVEVFAHGALCMAISGKCYLSLHTHNASANRGACRQNCRKRYEVRDEDGHELAIENEYIMSPKDLCTLPFIDELLQTGVRILKIEGRGRSADYVAEVTRCYREAIDAVNAGVFTPDKITEWLERLSTVYNRGFWDGYYLGRKLGEWTKDGAGSKAIQKKIYVGKGDKYYPKLGVAQFKVETNSLKRGDRLYIIGPKVGAVQMVLEDFHTDKPEALHAQKGDNITFLFDKKIGRSEKLYKIVEAN